MSVFIPAASFLDAAAAFQDVAAGVVQVADSMAPETLLAALGSQTLGGAE